MQQIQPVQSQTLDAPLPAPKTTSNKAVYPVNASSANTTQAAQSQLGLLGQVSNAKYGLNSAYAGQKATYNGNVDQPGFGFNGTSNGVTDAQVKVPQQPVTMPPKPGTTQTGGGENSAITPPKTTPGTTQTGGGAVNDYSLPPTQAVHNQYQNAQYNSVTGDALANAPKMNVPTSAYQNAQYNSVTGDALANAPKMNVPASAFVGNEYTSDGYSGAQTSKSYDYTPNDNSLVQNQISGLLDPNSDIMKKAIANAQAYSASRGLQSSSIGNEAALSSMIDNALPIAQQDAQTYGQAQTLGWQQQFTNDQENANRVHDASMADKQGFINNSLQNNQMQWQSLEKGLDREQQAELEDLKYKQSLGMLDAEGAQRLQELNAQQSWQSLEKGLDREQQAELEDLKYIQSLGMLDAEGAQRLQELNAQQSWQTSENNVNRDFQAQLEDLKYKQSLGTLDKQQELQLAQLEKSASIQTERDAILNKYQVELNNLQNDQRWQELTAQINSQFELRKMELSHDMQTQYGNSIGDATNAALNAIGLAMNNPSMTKEQQAAAVTEIMNSLNMQTNMLGILYGAIPAPTPGTATGTNTGPATGISNPNQPQIPYTPTTTPGTSVGASGGTSTGSTTSGGGTSGGGGGYKPAQKQK